MRIFRQEAVGDWGQVIDDVLAALGDWTGTAATPAPVKAARRKSMASTNPVTPA
jgi:hypothetical protein